MSRGSGWTPLLTVVTAGLLIILCCAGVLGLGALNLVRLPWSDPRGCAPYANACAVVVVNGYDEPIVLVVDSTSGAVPAATFTMEPRPGRLVRDLPEDCAGTRYRATDQAGNPLGQVVLESCDEQSWLLLPDGTTQLLDGFERELPTPLPSASPRPSPSAS